MPARFAPRMSVSSRSPMNERMLRPEPRDRGVEDRRAPACRRRSAGGRRRCARPRRACRCPARCRGPAESSSRCSWRPTGCPRRGGAARRANAPRRDRSSPRGARSPGSRRPGESSAERVTGIRPSRPRRRARLRPTTRISEPAGRAPRAADRRLRRGHHVVRTTVSPSSFRCSATDAVGARGVVRDVADADAGRLRRVDRVDGVRDGAGPAYTTPSRSARTGRRRRAGVASPRQSCGASSCRASDGRRPVSGLVAPVDDVSSMISTVSSPSGIVGALERDRRAVGSLPPLLGLLGVPEFLEHCRVGVEERGAPGERALGVELRDLQLAERGLGLPEVEPGAGHRDREGDLHRHVERSARHRTTELERGRRADRPRVRCRPSAAAGRSCR